MTDEGKKLDEVILTRLVRLNAKIHGLVTGLVFGLGLFVATNWLVLKGGKFVGRHLSLLGQFFIGYRVSFLGSLIGFVYAFVCGFIIGYSIAWMYNCFADRRGGKAK
jgi:formate hydrogenlyase subunit 3/multisubunit Na+/H+ antiporter MnhD subunit